MTHSTKLKQIFILLYNSFIKRQTALSISYCIRNWYENQSDPIVTTDWWCDAPSGIILIHGSILNGYIPYSALHRVLLKSITLCRE